MTTETEDTVRLALPADPEWGRVARTAAAGLALRLGFTFSQIEDLRLAIDETLILLLRPGVEGTIHLVFDRTDDGLEIWAQAPGGPDEARADEAARSRFAELVEPIVERCTLDEDLGRVHLVVPRVNA